MNSRLTIALLCLATGTFAADTDVSLFNGKSLQGWKTKGPAEKNQWKVGYASLAADNPSKLAIAETGEGPGQLINAANGVDGYTVEQFGDGLITLELMVPKGSNSGVYVMGEYEVQILDSFGKDKPGPGDLGGLYNAAAPRKNVAKKPGEWQTMEIDFQAPKFDGDKKIANAVFKKVSLNGEVIHENVEMKGPTPGGLTGKEAAQGPLMLQGDHGPVAFRNLHIQRKDQGK